MSKEWEQDPEFDGIDQDSIKEYRKFMVDNYHLIRRNRPYFLRDSKFSTAFKIERVDELLDFFIIEEDYEKCKDLSSLKEVLEIKLIINEHD